MHPQLVQLHEPVPHRLSGELAKRIHYLSERIDRFELVTAVGQDAEVTGLRLWLTAEEPLEALTRKVNRLVESEILPQRAIRPRELWRSGLAPATLDGVFDALVAARAVIPTGEGQFIFGLPFSGLLDVLDGLVREAAHRAFAAPEVHCPSLIRTEILARSGYLTSFPQLLLFADRLHTDLDDYQAFLDVLAPDQHKADPLPAVTRALSERATHSGYVLSPAVCYHVYEQHAGTTLPGPLTVTSALGSCYRHESRYHHSLERLWEFSMREIILIGEEEAVARARGDFMRDVFALMDELELAGHVEVASDPFFCNAQAASRTWAQKALELKHELVLPVSGGGSVAAASFNAHGTTLGEVFGISLGSGDPASTGCIAFGLERLGYAFVSRHGLEPADWPKDVRTRYERSHTA